MIVGMHAVSLIYQYWIHTDTIRRLGPFEKVFNTPSHHRVHHGSNKQYLDRNHGSILIAWDRLFGTFEPEAEPVVYGLTKNLDTFNPARVAGHEHFEMLRDVSRSESWREKSARVSLAAAATRVVAVSSAPAKAAGTVIVDDGTGAAQLADFLVASGAL